MSSPPSVIHVIAGMDSRSGGPVTALAGLARSQMGAGMDVSILHSFIDGDSDEISIQLQAEGVAVRSVGPSWHRRLKLVRGVESALSGLDPKRSVLHLHGLWEDVHYRAARFAMANRIPFIIRPCGMLDPWSLGQSALFKRLYRLARLDGMLAAADLLHFTTERERSLALTTSRFRQGVVVPNGVSLTEVDQAPIGDRGGVVFVGRIHPKKALEVLIDALNLLRATGLSPRCSIIGGGDNARYVEELREGCRIKGIADQVQFTGHLEPTEVMRRMRAASVLVLPSWQENFGNVVVEAASLGVPSIVSDQVNLCEDLVGAGAGWVFKLDKRFAHTAGEGLASLIRLALTDEGECRRRGEAARVWSRNYHWSAIALQWKRIYSELLDARQRA